MCLKGCNLIIAVWHFRTLEAVNLHANHVLGLFQVNGSLNLHYFKKNLIWQSLKDCHVHDHRNHQSMAEGFFVFFVCVCVCARVFLVSAYQLEQKKGLLIS